MNVFNARDGMFDLLVDGGYPLSPTAAGLLWFMLFNTIYDPGSKYFCHVNPVLSTNAALSTGTRRGEKSVRRGMAELEELGFIERTAQFGYSGFQRENLIKMTTPDDFCWAYRRRGHAQDSRCNEECS